MKKLSTLLLLFSCMIGQAQKAYQIAFKSGAKDGVTGGLLSSVISGSSNKILALSIEAAAGSSGVTELNYDGTFIRKYNIKNVSSIDDNSYTTIVKIDENYAIEGSGKADASILILDKDFKLVKLLKALYAVENSSNKIAVANRIEAIDQDRFLFYHAFSADAFSLFDVQSTGTTNWQKRFKYKLEDGVEKLPIFTGLATNLGNDFITTSKDVSQSYVTKYSADGKPLLNKSIKNFEAINSKIDRDGNHYIVGRDLIKSKFALLKLDQNLNFLYGKYLKDAEVVTKFYPSMLQLIDNADAMIALPNTAYEGLQLFRISKEGQLVFVKMILDKEPASSTSLFDLKDGTLLLRNSLSLLRRINENGTADDCVALDLCHKLMDYQPEFGTFDLQEIPCDSLKIGDGILITEASDSTYHYCNKVALPSASFSLPQLDYCVLEQIKPMTEAIHPFGLSTWELRSESESQFRSGKSIDFAMPNVSKATIIHTLIIGDCQYQDSIKVLRKNGTFDFLPSDTTICENASLTISVDRNAIRELLWSDGDTSYIKKINEVTEYRCSGINAEGCFSSDFLTLSHNKLPYLELGFDNIICIGSTVTLNPVVMQGETIEWFDGSKTNEYIVEGLTSVYGTLTNECGIDQDTITFEYIDCNETIVFPNIFSPNGDNVNDDLIFKAKDVIFLSVQIFDRRNKLIVQSQNTSSFSWDGTMNNCPVEVGVYTFIAKIKRSNQIDIATYIGNFTLIR